MRNYGRSRRILLSLIYFLSLRNNCRVSALSCTTRIRSFHTQKNVWLASKILTSTSLSASKGSFEYQSLLKDKLPRPKEELLTHDQIALISSLVEKRSVARLSGNYQLADSLRDEIDAIHQNSLDGDSSESASTSTIILPQGYKVSVKDIPRNEGGGSTWSLQPITKVQSILVDEAMSKNDSLNDDDNVLQDNPSSKNSTNGSVLGLAHAALGLASSASERGKSIDNERLNDIARKAKQRLTLTGEQELRGRKAADAAFWFALAGVRDRDDSDSNDFSLFDALAFISLEELKRFGRRSSCRAMDIMQIIERFAAAGVKGKMFELLQYEAAACLESKDPNDIQELERRGVIETLRNGEFELHSERSLLWIFRFATRQRKQRAFLRSAAKHWENQEGEESLQNPNTYEHNDALELGEMFRDPSLPLVVDIGCGMGVSVLGLSTLDRKPPPMNNEDGNHMLNFDWSKCNYLGVDLSRLAINYATSISKRWNINHRTQFVVASAEDALEWISGTYPGNVEFCMIQFPTPYRFNIEKMMDDTEIPSAANQGNKQLPNDAFSGFMVTRRLLHLVRDALNEESGRLLVQSNVEDVAVYMKTAACEVGFEVLTADRQVLEVNESKDGLPQRTKNWISIGGERAEGDAWNAMAVLDDRAATETEVSCLQNGTPVHRCLLKKTVQ